MNWKFKLTVLCLLAAIALHVYLTFHYYPVNFGMSDGEAFCNLNEVFSCDAASASPFAALFGVPIAAWGASTNLLLLIFVIGYGIGWSEAPDRLRRYATYLAGFTALVSVAMFTISAFALRSYCLFCMALYALSFAVFGLLVAQRESALRPRIGPDVRALFGEARSLLLTVAIGIPAMAVLVHLAFVQMLNIQGVDQAAEAAVRDWQANPLVKFEQMPSLTKGAPRESASMVIVEFADFLCIHCKMASPSLQAFIKSHPDARLEFFNFPLDGACNPVMSQARGTSCRLAKAVHCAGAQNLGWELSDLVFKNQEDLASVGTVDAIDKKLKDFGQQVRFDWETLKTCMDSEDTHRMVTNQARVGEIAQVRGTPTIYVNGRKLPNGQMIPVLERARRKAAEQPTPSS